MTDQVTPEPVTCPVCGMACHVEGDQDEGTMYYVPIFSAAQLEEAQEQVRVLREAGRDLESWLENMGLWQTDDAAWLATVHRFRRALADTAPQEKP